MSTLTEGQHRGEFLVSTANNSRSFEKVTIASGQDLKAGHVLGVVTASGEYSEYDPDNDDGTETAVAVLYDNVDASDGALEATIVARDAEVNGAELVWFADATEGEKTTGKSELADVGIIAR